MESLIKSLAKTAALNVSFTRTKMLQREFLRSTPSCRGIYSSFAAASSAAPVADLAGYDHPTIAGVYREKLEEFKYADYPVLFWLARLLPEARVVFELGGSIGRGFYPYDRYLKFASDLRWIICDLPAMVQLGAEIARERNARQLTFTTERETAFDPDIYTTFGTLQYIEEPFETIIGQLRRPPPHILVNRVPLTNGAPFITLQNNGSWFSPYKVDNRASFIASLVGRDYELVDDWQMERPNAFFMEEEDRPDPRYCGMYFRLKKPAPGA